MSFLKIHAFACLNIKSEIKEKSEMRKILLLIFLIFCISFCLGCGVSATDEDQGREESLNIIEDPVIDIERKVVITSEDIQSYMDEITYSHPDNLGFDELKGLAVERAIIVAVLDIYFEEKGIVASDEEIDAAIDRHAWRCGMTYRGFLAALLENFRNREIRRDISTEVRVQKLIVKMMKNGVTPGVARKTIEEEINERIKKVEAVFLRPLKREIWT